MRFALSEEQASLRDTTRRFLREHAPPERVRETMETELGYDRDLWRRVTRELGWAALAVPHAYGGYGLDAVEIAVLMEEMGRALLCSPFFSTVCLGGAAVTLGGSAEQKAAVLPGIVSGERTATLAWTARSWGVEGITATRIPSGWRLDGTASHVVDGYSADLLVIAAREPTEVEDEIHMFLVHGTARGLSRRRLPTMDMTRRLGEIVLEDVVVSEEAALPGGGRALAATLDRAVVALGAEQVGVAEACLDMAVAHARTRRQFNRPIGQFQAIKHKCADMLVLVECARSAAWYAAWAAVHEQAALPVAAAVAKATCSDAAFRCAAENIQIHGGLGFTWDHDAHLYFKRAKSSETFMGDSARQRDRVAHALGW